MARQAVGVPLPYLRAWRQRKLMTQMQLAEAAGVNPSTERRAEKGDEVVSYANVKKLAAALGVSTDDLRFRDPSGTTER